MTDAEFILERAKFVVAGGIWGDAAWRMHRDKIYSLGQGVEGNFLKAPTEVYAPTCLWIYGGPFDESWDPKKYGEPPTTKHNRIPEFVTYVFPSLVEALHAVSWLMRAASWQEVEENPTAPITFDPEEVYA